VALSGAAARWPERPLLETDSVGRLPRVNLSVKVTALTPLVRPHAPHRGRADAARRLIRLLRCARDLDAHLHIDMESFDVLDVTRGLVFDLLSRAEFADGPSAGIVLQAYLRESEQAPERVLEWCRSVRRSPPLTIRLVKGAYWDHEFVLARQHGWQSPVWTEKVETDRCFERLSARLIDTYPQIRPAIASHSLRSLAHTIAYARRCGLGPADIELQVLRGLGDDLQASLSRSGYRCRTYCPVGELVEGMAYLVRRLLENTANDSFFVRQLHGTSIPDLITAP
jgi:RHH-type proline utilization regulon transcriptional repressor/proline dehydrogenase/delta 1-pyrroline-5-carboxylate dehydrogenase